MENRAVTWPLDPDSKVDKIRKDAILGRSVTCVVLRLGPSHSYSRTFCFDEGSGALIKYEDRTVHGVEIHEYDDFRLFAGKLVPRQARILEEDAETVSVKIQELEPLTGEEFLYDAPPEAKALPICMGTLTFPRLKHSPDPDVYNVHTGKWSRATVSLIIGEDGAPREFAVTETVGKNDTKVLEALRKWRFQPALCDRKAFPAEVNVEINMPQP